VNLDSDHTFACVPVANEDKRLEINYSLKIINETTKEVGTALGGAITPL